jgi:hypothetical protein
MELRDDSATLLRDLDDSKLTVLILYGDEGSVADEVHSQADSWGMEPWRKVFLIRDPAILREAGVEDCLAAKDRYCVVRGGTKQVVAVGAISDLLTPSGRPSVLSIRSAFSRADAL